MRPSIGYTGKDAMFWDGGGGGGGGGWLRCAHHETKRLATRGRMLCSSGLPTFAVVFNLTA